MTPCDRPDCAGSILEDGFCDICAHRPLGGPAGGRSALPGFDSALRRGRESAVRGAAGRWWGMGLVDLPEVGVPAPEEAVEHNPQVAEEDRFCGGCRRPVGRKRGSRPGLTRGFCPYCGRPFAFVPTLRPGDLLGEGDRYEVIGCLDRGGLGWIHLARDTHLDRLVALKGHIDKDSEKTAQALADERRFLTAVDHPNIVRVHDFVEFPDPGTGTPIGYIVMDYVGGPSLKRYYFDRRHSAVSLPLEHVIAYGLEILAAFDYLHSREMLYCDLKPGNVIRTGTGIKVVDLGAVRTFDDEREDIYGTNGFCVPAEEISEYGLSVGSDLYTVGKTLDCLFGASEDWYGEEDDAAAAASPIAVGIESFRRLIAQAVRSDRERRFSSAAEMAEQLAGVLREVLALRDGVARPQPSRLFTAVEASADAGLGAVPGLDRWTAQPHPWDHAGWSPPLHDGRPSAAQAATSLPAPLPDPADPAIGDLAGLSATDPSRLLAELDRRDDSSVEILLRRCRARLALGGDDLDRAGAHLGDAARLAPYDWRIDWHRGLLELARGRLAGAEKHLTEVCLRLAGESAPKLALALCAELQGRVQQAGRHYAALQRTDRSQAAAGFGLARVRLAAGDRAGAVAALDDLPLGSRYFDAARIAAVRIHAGRLPGPRDRIREDELPGWDDIAAASRRVGDLALGTGKDLTETRDRLVVVVQEIALDLLRSPKGVPGPDPSLDVAAVLGPAPITEGSLRDLLDHSVRALADQSPTRDGFLLLIELANRVRPRTWWTWR